MTWALIRITHLVPDFYTPKMVWLWCASTPGGLSTLLVVGVISHLWCGGCLVCIAQHSFYSVSGESSGRSNLKFDEKFYH